MKISKIKSYIGFATKMNKVVFGVDNIKKCKSKQYVILFDDSLSDNSVRQITNFSDLKNIRLIKLDYSLAEAFKRERVKVISILDESLAKAILTEVEVQYE